MCTVLFAPTNSNIIIYISMGIKMLKEYSDHEFQYYSKPVASTQSMMDRVSSSGGKLPHQNTQLPPQKEGPGKRKRKGKRERFSLSFLFSFSPLPFGGGGRGGGGGKLGVLHTFSSLSPLREREGESVYVFGAAI